MFRVTGGPTFLTAVVSGSRLKGFDLRAILPIPLAKCTLRVKRVNFMNNAEAVYRDRYGGGVGSLHGCLGRLAGMSVC